MPARCFQTAHESVRGTFKIDDALLLLTRTHDLLRGRVPEPRRIRLNSRPRSTNSWTRSSPPTRRGWVPHRLQIATLNLLNHARDEFPVARSQDHRAPWNHRPRFQPQDRGVEPHRYRHHFHPVSSFIGMKRTKKCNWHNGDSVFFCRKIWSWPRRYRNSRLTLRTLSTWGVRSRPNMRTSAAVLKMKTGWVASFLYIHLLKWDYTIFWLWVCLADRIKLLKYFEIEIKFD